MPDRARENTLHQEMLKGLRMLGTQHTYRLMRKAPAFKPVSRPTTVDGGKVNEELDREGGTRLPHEAPVLGRSRAGEKGRIA